MEPRGRVLVVNSEASARSALRALLLQEGFAVEAAADGHQALAQLSEVAPHVVIADLGIPGLDVAELLRKGKAADPDLIVVVTAGPGQTAAALSAMRAGAADFLQQPL